MDQALRRVPIITAYLTGSCNMQAPQRLRNHIPSDTVSEKAQKKSQRENVETSKCHE